MSSLSGSHYLGKILNGMDTSSLLFPFVSVHCTSIAFGVKLDIENLSREWYKTLSKVYCILAVCNYFCILELGSILGAFVSKRKNVAL